MKSVVKTICELLERGEDLTLASVINQKGSAPRSSGAKMIIKRDGKIIGSIGGGKMEAEVIKAAPRIFQDNAPEIKVFHLNENLGKGVDSICGGKMEVLLEWIADDAETLEFYQILLTIREKSRAWLLTALPQAAASNAKAPRCLIKEDGSIIGNISISETDLSSLIKKKRQSKNPSVWTLGDHSFWMEPIFPPITVYFFGAGHVAQQTAIFAALTDFRTVIIDDREEFANAERFENADQILTPKSFDSCFETLTINKNSYIVILTRGHRYDKTVLAQALKTEADYIGMIGSKNKTATIYKDLLSRGFSQSDLKRVHSPIGLDIKAETPQEIGVSITAELIARRAEQQPSPNVL